MKSTILLCSFVLIGLLFSCAQRASNEIDADQEPVVIAGETAEKITIAAAANLRFALDAIELDFEKNNPIDLEIIIASSGKLYSQISNGAPFDIFMSANMKYPLSLFHNKLTAEKPIVHALGSLIMWTTKDLDLSDGLNRLLEDDIKKIAIASDKNAPYGSAAVEALKSAKLYDKIASKLIYGESVSQVNQYVSSESVDVGLTNKSVIFGKLEDEGVWKDVDHSLYHQLEQGIVVTNYGQVHHPKESQVFLNYLFTPSAQKILANYGYLAPQP